MHCAPPSLYSHLCHSTATPGHGSGFSGYSRSATTYIGQWFYMNMHYIDISLTSKEKAVVRMRVQMSLIFPVHHCGDFFPLVCRTTVMYGTTVMVRVSSRTAVAPLSSQGKERHPWMNGEFTREYQQRDDSLYRWFATCSIAIHGMAHWGPFCEFEFFTTPHTTVFILVLVLVLIVRCNLAVAYVGNGPWDTMAPERRPVVLMLILIMF